MKRFVLASSSPRRMEILKALGIEFEIISSNYEEILTNGSPYELVCNFAIEKARDVAGKICKSSIIIAADTIVYANGGILGKPKDEKDAENILKMLSGNCHSVITGVCIINTEDNRIYSGYEETKVFFKELSEEEIKAYIATSEPMDKAGAYGIQGIGGLFVKKIDGCYFNVVGLPIYKLNYLLGKMGVNLLIKEV